MVECTGLENRQGFTPLEGSNPSPSATKTKAPPGAICFNEGGVEENPQGLPTEALAKVAERSRGQSPPLPPELVIIR